MSYGLIYKIYVPSVRKNKYTIEIEEKDYTGESTDITGGSEPFTTSLEDDDFVYTPLRLSTAKMAVVGGDALSSLFATSYQQYRVTLIKDAVPVWCGFIKPELYTQDYSTHTHEIEMDCMSAVSTLEYVKYTQADSAGLKFVSLKSLIARALTAANGRYSKIYIPHTFAATAADYGTNALMRDDCVISEQNFFDEEDKPMSFKDILEEICRFSHTTLFDDYGNLYFADHDYTDAYDEWTLADGALTMTTANALSISSHSVQTIGFGGSGHALDIIAGYNKATVKTNNYKNGDKVFPDENWDSLKALYIDDESANIYYVLGKNDIQKLTCKSRCIWLVPSAWQPRMYESAGTTEDGVKMSTLEVGTYGGYYNNNGTPICEKVTEVTDINHFMVNSGFGYKEFKPRYGAYIAKYCEWQLDDDGKDTITSYSFDHIMFIRVISMHSAGDAGTAAPKHDTVYFDPTKYNGLFNYSGHMPVAAYADGAIAINMQVVTTGQGFGSEIQGIAKNGYYYSGEENTFAEGAKIKFTFILRIGTKYWNGTAWTETASTFDVSTQEMKKAGSFTQLETNKTLSMPYNDLSGWVIETNGTLKGELYFSIRNASMNCAIKDLSLKYQLKDDYTADTTDGDRVYTNVVNADYINEMEDIEEKISSYNHDGLCYSKVLLGDDFIQDALYEGINKVTTRPENLLLRRIVNQYDAPKIKLTQVLMNGNEDVKPIDRLTDEYQGTGKKFVITGKETKYRSDTSEIIMIEKE
jgi:hypothetical protein